MTKVEGMKRLDRMISNLQADYSALEERYSAASHPISPDGQAKAEEIIRASVSISCMALNFKDLPQSAKKPFAALLYAAADALTGGDSYA